LIGKSGGKKHLEEQDVDDRIISNSNVKKRYMIMWAGLTCFRVGYWGGFFFEHDSVDDILENS
jgi:hypothetical protein